MVRTTTFRGALLALCCLVVLALTAPLFTQSRTKGDPTGTQLAVGKPTVFKVTVTKVELHNGTSYVTVFSGSSQLDLVSAAGATAFPGISNLTLPAATYSKVRVTFINGVAVKGTLASGGVTYYMTSTLLALGGGSLASATGPSAEVTLLAPDFGALGDSVTQEFAISSITVNSSTSYAPTLKFDVTSGLALWNDSGVIYFTVWKPITISVF